MPPEFPKKRSEKTREDDAEIERERDLQMAMKSSLFNPQLCLL
jgi:hypothetical protein